MFEPQNACTKINFIYFTRIMNMLITLHGTDSGVMWSLEWEKTYVYGRATTIPNLIFPGEISKACRSSEKRVANHWAIRTPCTCIMFIYV